MACELVVGSMLWARKPGARRLSVALLPLEFAYWIGFPLPLGHVPGVLGTAAAVNFDRGRSEPAKLKEPSDAIARLVRS